MWEPVADNPVSRDLAGLGFSLGRSDLNLRGHHEEEGEGVSPWRIRAGWN